MNKNISKNYIENIIKLRKELKYGDLSTQNQIDDILTQLIEFKDLFIPNETDEILTLVNAKGQFIDITAPRWICHLLGLRHKSVHVLLQWQSPMLGKVFIFQVRSWEKSDSPGHLDISVGGHVIGNAPSIVICTAYKEMEEELGITKNDLEGNGLTFVKGYEYKEKRKKEYFFNTEWRDVYIGEISSEAFERIKFKDNEVVGLYLCPQAEALNLLNQTFFPIASALKNSLPYCLDDKS